MSNSRYEALQLDADEFAPLDESISDYADRCAEDALAFEALFDDELGYWDGLDSDSDY